jgi:hypothetical protein
VHEANFLVIVVDVVAVESAVEVSAIVSTIEGDKHCSLAHPGILAQQPPS